MPAKANKLVSGVGINDAAYPTSPIVEGKRVYCPFYIVWTSMLKRCYSESSHRSRPNYKDCTVCEEWKLFSTFKTWMETQDWQGKQLDKDLLVEGNKLYSPTTCLFVPKEVNQFLNTRSNDRGNYPIGVSWIDSNGKNYAANCHEIGKGTKYLGAFSTPEEAHLAYKSYKQKLATDLASRQDDPRVASALVSRYCNT